MEWVLSKCWEPGRNEALKTAVLHVFLGRIGAVWGFGSFEIQLDLLESMCNLGCAPTQFWISKGLLAHRRSAQSIGRHSSQGNMGNIASGQPSPTSVTSNHASACEDREVPEVLVGGAVVSVDCALQHAIAAHAALPLTITALGAAYVYGRKLATDPNPALDPVGVRAKLESVSKSIDVLVDCGYLSYYRICGTECLAVAGLNFLTHVERKPCVSALIPTGDLHQKPVM